MEKLKVLLTGSSGFVGSHLIKTLKNDNNLEVIIFQGDLLDQKSLKSFFKKYEHIDVVIHLVGLFSNNFDDLLKINLVATRNLLENLANKNIKKFIFSSTGAVYGLPINKKSLESDPLNAITSYGLSKIFAEECIKFYSRMNNFSYSVLRFSNIFGKEQKKGVIYNLLSNIKTNKLAIIHGDGQQRRDFLYVKDASNAIYKSIHDPKNQTLNISSDLNLSINDLLNLFKKHIDFKTKYIEQRDGILNLSLDYQKAKKELNIENNYSNIESINNILFSAVTQKNKK